MLHNKKARYRNGPKRVQMLCPSSCIISGYEHCNIIIGIFLNLPVCISKITLLQSASLVTNMYICLGTKMYPLERLAFYEENM